MTNIVTENSTKELHLFPVQGKKIEFSFSGDRVSSDGELLLLRELDGQLNLLSSVCNCIIDEKDYHYFYRSFR